MSLFFTDISNQKSEGEIFKMETESLESAIKEVEKTLRKYHLSYEQFSYVTKIARRRTQLKRQGHPKAEIKRLSSDQQNHLIHKAYTLKGTTGLLIKTLLFSGARVSEFATIRVEDCDFQAPGLIIRNGKGSKQRIVPITEGLSHELQTYLGKRTKGYLFESRLHKAFTPRRLQQIVKQVAFEAGIEERVYPHLLRHSVATFLLEHGMPLDQIQVFLGHSRIENTQIYAKNSAFKIQASYQQAMKHL